MNVFTESDIETLSITTEGRNDIFKNPFLSDL